jgi:hypothetical protein
MKTVTSFVTALALLGFGSAAIACEGNMYKPRNADTAETTPPIVLPSTTQQTG